MLHLIWVGYDRKRTLLDRRSCVADLVTVAQADRRLLTVDFAALSGDAKDVLSLAVAAIGHRVRNVLGDTLFTLVLIAAWGYAEEVVTR